jgi:hypothetical protein
MMKAASSSETSVNTYQTTGCYISEDNHLDIFIAMSTSYLTKQPDVFDTFGEYVAMGL